jgi:two-component system LytT family response regulator
MDLRFNLFNIAQRCVSSTALDFLLKPVARERLATAIQKSVSTQNILVQPAIASTPKTRTDQIFVRDGERCHFIKLSNLHLISVNM